MTLTAVILIGLWMALISFVLSLAPLSAAPACPAQMPRVIFPAPGQGVTMALGGTRPSDYVRWSAGSDVVSSPADRIGMAVGRSLGVTSATRCGPCASSSNPRCPANRLYVG